MKSDKCFDGECYKCYNRFCDCWCHQGENETKDDLMKVKYKTVEGDYIDVWVSPRTVDVFYDFIEPGVIALKDMYGSD
jgi:hypothetical protein